VLTIPGPSLAGFCDGLSRRSFLRAGSLGVAGITLPRILEAADTSTAISLPRSVVMIYLCGGPTQHETFDPKPNSPKEIRGSFSPISTAIPGVQFCELLPQLSLSARRFSVVRTLTGMQNRHESFQCYSGRPGGRNGDNEPAGGWPTFGSVASLVQGPGPGGMLPYVDASPQISYGPYRNRGLHDASGRESWPGFTGLEHIPFASEGDIKKDLVLNGANKQRLGSRRSLLETLRRHRDRKSADNLDAFQDRAFGLLTSNRLVKAMELENEPRSTRDRYGKLQPTHSSFGGAPQDPQRLLLARRLIEAGVRCVTVGFGAWDWHSNREGSIEFLSKKYLPVFDHSVSVFLQDMEERGLLETTTVIVWGEFGRTPRINGKGGRDHWPGTQSVLMAGGGVQGGRIVGESDRVGGVPASRPVHVQEIFATLYRNLGIDTNSTKVSDFNGRPRYLVENNRQPVGELF
jgi:hypothetical protein